MKTKFYLIQPVRDYIEWELEHYHENKRQLEEYKIDMIPSCVATYSLVQSSNHSETTDTTAQRAIKLATSPYILNTERNVKAIEAVLAKCDDTDKKLINMVYWKRAYNISGAGAVAGLGKTGAYDRINKIIFGIALEMGLVNI